MRIDPNGPEDEPEVRQMVVIHKALRKQFALLPEQVRAVADGDRARAAAVADHVRSLLLLLHAHHHSEDEVLWPLLQQRAPLEEALIREMEAQHGAVDAGIRKLTPLVAAWAERGDRATASDIAAELAGLTAHLDEHLDAEEEKVFPLVLDHLNVAEWESVVAEGPKQMPSSPRIGMVTIGVVLDAADPAEGDWFFRNLPAKGKIAWRVFGRSYYRRYSARLGTTAV
ncbi:hemerythrin domain-containing protein [Actinokineospora spheciospongiae]|uniref:hemerythrin domain-containing protein n=1 Tax=Actinokineospora spheciospongiae TaxID=909613 RepID=UPI000D71072B|nr:hemerythrin domain-containing protein [Actinokineospora spheciospongiae]PWW66652.1 hemerythrin-like domain-containing protein [Actinokineospora spheciospongiae]